MKRKNNCKKILVTGGTGFIGKNLVRNLIIAKNDVRVLTKDSRNVTLIEEMGAKAIVKNLNNIDHLKKSLDGVDICYHLAAIRSDWGHKREDYYKVNVGFTRNLLEASVGRIKHFIFISSVKAIKPKTLYGKSKMMAEKIAISYFQNKKLPLTIIRPAIVYGPGDSDNGFFAKFIKLIKNKFFIIVGNGENFLHLVYVDDLVNALILAGEKRGMGKSYIVASQNPITLNQFVSLTSEKLKADCRLVYVPIFLARFIGSLFELIYRFCPFFPNKEPLITRNKVDTISGSHVYDISSTKEELGYVPKIDYKNGVTSTIEYYKKRWT